MRQRRVKGLETKILGYGKYFVDTGSGCELKGKWNGFFGNGNDLYLEIGAGKGQFLIWQAGLRPDRNHIGVEGHLSVVFRALQKLEAAKLDNIVFAGGFVNDAEELFAAGEAAGIYLNFSDPWPKKRHSHRRLTHRNYLRQYHRILKKGGFIEFKTDDGPLFDFTLEEIEAVNTEYRPEDIEAVNSCGKTEGIKTACTEDKPKGIETVNVYEKCGRAGTECERFKTLTAGRGKACRVNPGPEDERAGTALFRIEAVTRDLHGSELEAKNITTEYEEKFIAEGRSVKYIRMVSL